MSNVLRVSTGATLAMVVIRYIMSKFKNVQRRKFFVKHKRNRIISFTLMLAVSVLLLQMFTPTAQAAVTQVSTLDALKTALQNGGEIQLTADITTTETLIIVKTTALDLNGFGILMTGNGRVIETTEDESKVNWDDLANEASLRLLDSGPNSTHYITLNNDGRGTAVSTTNTGNAIEVKGGYITGGGGGIAVKGKFANLNMSGGSIIGNVTTGDGGGVFMGDSTKFEMSGGSIRNNTASGKGGGVYANAMMGITMSGSSITGNTAGNDGGGVFMGENVSLYMSDGFITGNTTGGNGGGVCVIDPDSTFSLSGSPNITGNFKNSDGVKTKNNVYLSAGDSESARISFSGALSSTAKIGVTMPNPGNLAFVYASYASISNFTSDNSNYKIVRTENPNNPSSYFMTLEQHIHNFTYVKSGDDTIVATCSTQACGLTDSKAIITLTPPTTGGGAAALSGDSDLFTVSDVTYSQKSGSNWGTPTTEVPSANGFFRASITVNTGSSTTETLSVTYGVNAITVKSGIAHGTVTAPAVATVGVVVPITITPEIGYILDTLTPTKTDGGASIAVTNQSFIMPDEEVTVNATFKLADYNISCELASGSITPTSPTAHYNDKVRLVVTPNFEYGVKTINVPGVTLNLVSRDTDMGIEVYELTMPNNDISVNVELAERTIYTIFYKATDSATSILYRFTNDDDDGYIMRSDAKMGDIACWAGQVNEVIGKTSVPISFNVNGGGWGALTNCNVVTDLSSINSMADGSAVLIPGDDKAFIASFRAGAYDTDANGKIIVRDDLGNKNYFVSSNTTNITVPIPTKARYDFVGWSYEDQNGESKTIAPGSGKNVTVAINGNINKTTIFNAVWQRSNPLVVYDLRGGSWSRSNNETVAYGEKLAKSVTPTKEGYAFDRWVLGADCKGMRNNGDEEIALVHGSEFDFDNTRLVETIRLKAQWKHVHAYSKIPLTEINDVMPGVFSQEQVNKYNNSLHVALCADLDDLTCEAHEFGADGKCVCGFDRNTAPEITVEISYNDRDTKKPSVSKHKMGSTVSLTPPPLGASRFVKWEYRPLDGTTWRDIAQFPAISVPVNGSVRINAVFDGVDKPKMILQATTDSTDIDFTMSYLLPAGCTAKNAVIAFGDNYLLFYKKVVRQFVLDPPSTSEVWGIVKEAAKPQNIIATAAKVLGEINDMTNKIVNSAMNVVGIDDPTVRNLINFTVDFVIAGATGQEAGLAGMLIKAGVEAVGLDGTVVGDAINLATSIATGDAEDALEIAGDALALAHDITGGSTKVDTEGYEIVNGNKGHYELQYWAREDNLLSSDKFKVPLMLTMLKRDSITLPGYNNAIYHPSKNLGDMAGYVYTGYTNVKDMYEGNRYFYALGYVVYTDANDVMKLAVVGPIAVTYNQVAASPVTEEEVLVMDF